MRVKNKLIFLICILAVRKCSAADEIQFSIQPNKAVQLLDERFVSFTVDPSVFFIGLSASPVTTKLVKHLLPAYLRVAGASTNFLEFTVDEHRTTKVLNDDATSLAFSPAMWWSLNEWLHQTNLTPIYALNDQDQWDPKKWLPLLDMTAKMNINCDWQLGFDCSEKGFEQYKEDLTSLRHTLDMFPTKKDQWRVIGSDLSKCVPSDHTDILRMYLADLHDVDVVMWANDETLATSSSFLAGDVMLKLLSFHPANIPVWISSAKVAHSITFANALDWAVEMGEAARNGFNVIFREPRLQEFYSATPVYWVTVLHKQLMGRNVLDVKTSSSLIHSTSVYIYAHCSRDQNSFPVRGAVTVMIANNGTDTHRAALRLPQQMKSIEVQSYVLSGKAEETYLNDEKLDLDAFALQPKQRRAKILTHLTLSVPPKAIGFFVLPGARVPVCINDEDDTDLVLGEIERIQTVELGERGKSAALMNRLKAARSSLSLIDLRRQLEDEFKTDSARIPRLQIRTPPLPPSRSASLPIRPSNDVQLLIDKVQTNVRNLLRKEDESRTKLDLELSSADVLKILGDRARAKLERKVGLADFDGLLFDKTKFKRDINMDLLAAKVHDEEQKAVDRKLRKNDKNVKDLSLFALPTYSSKPILDPLDLTSLIALLQSQPATTSTTSTPLTSSPKTYDHYSKGFDKQIDDLEDNFHAHHFFEHFGDSVQIDPNVGGAWKPEDFLQHEFIINDDDVPGTINKLENYFNQHFKRRIPRRVDGSINSMENEIDDFLQPVLNRKSGEYTFVFPSHDKVSLVQQSKGDAHIVVSHEPDDDSVESKTCRADDLYTSTEGFTLGKFLEGLRNSIAKENKIEKRTERSEYIQKIPYKPVGRDDKSIDADDDSDDTQLAFLWKLKNGFSKMMRKVHAKVDQFLKCIDG